MRYNHQSNPVEICPECGKRLTNRAAAASHYRTHVKDGSMREGAKVGQAVFCWHGDWFRLGIGESSTRSFEQMKADWFKKLKLHQKLYKHLNTP